MSGSGGHEARGEIRILPTVHIIELLVSLLNSEAIAELVEDDFFDDQKCRATGEPKAHQSCVVVLWICGLVYKDAHESGYS